ncbi:hypothetical protein [Gilliamella sp. BG6]|uniref:hypothetical protein n=1 Tax=unclassified Gilliamella TaxID=2685620 RepID=UPI0039872C89
MNINAQEKRNKQKDKETRVVVNTCEYLINKGFTPTLLNGKKFNFDDLLVLHSQLFEKNYNDGNCNIDGEEIFLNLTINNLQSDWISFKPGCGFRYVITGYSDTLCDYMYAIQALINYIQLYH